MAAEDGVGQTVSTSQRKIVEAVDRRQVGSTVTTADLAPGKLMTLYYRALLKEIELLIELLSLPTNHFMV